MRRLQENESDHCSAGVDNIKYGNAGGSRESDVYQTEGVKASQVESIRCRSKAKIDSLLKDLVYETESVTKVKN